MRIAFFGSSLLSAYWNGAATYYRGLLKALHRRGHELVFFEPDAFQRQSHRDIEPPPYARVEVYAPNRLAAEACLAGAAAWADVLVKASGVGVLDDDLAAGILRHRLPHQLAIYWDVDAPATLASLHLDPNQRLARLLPHFDAVCTYGGGPPVVAAYRAKGVQLVVPVYNAVDPETHHPVPPDARFAADLAFLGNRLPDREARVQSFFIGAARLDPDRSFRLAGAGWDRDDLPPNVDYNGHLYTADHNAWNCTPLAVLNLARESMAAVGWSPATRVFEAAGAGACLLTDDWPGLPHFLAPDREIIPVGSASDIVRVLNGLTLERAQAIGEAARLRVLRHHTYAQRALVVEELLAEATARNTQRQAV